MDYEIETDIPYPRRGGCGRPASYPTGRLLPGESFFVPEQDSTGPAASSARSLARRRGWEVTSRVVTENGVKGVRIWRIA